MVTSIAGTYTLSYNVIDSSNNPASEVTRTVIVAPTMISDCISISDYTTPSDNQPDDTPFQHAMDYAQSIGVAICLPVGSYQLNNSLVIPAGVQLRGSGIGDTSSMTSLSGSVIEYSGSSWAIKMSGSLSGIKDIRVSDTSNQTALGGINIESDGAAVEGINLNNVLIDGFEQGTGLQLYAKNNSQLTNSIFYDIRVIDAKVGINIEGDSSADSIYSNRFIHGAISGSGFDYGIHIQTGHNNVFDGTVISPDSSQFGHIVVSDGELVCADCFIQATNQASDTPIIKLNNDTKGSRITGHLEGGFFSNLGDNSIHLASTGNISYRHTGINQLKNAAFNGVYNDLIPEWTFSGSPTVTEQSSEILIDHNVISVSGATELAPATPLTAFASSPLHSTINMGIYANTSVADTVKIAVIDNNTTYTSTAHPGDGQWHFIGLSVPISDLTSGTRELTPTIALGGVNVELTAPKMTLGAQERPKFNADMLPDYGGTLYGQVAQSTHSVDEQHYLDNSVKRLVLPTTGNVFFANFSSLSTDPLTIHKINDLTESHFDNGSIITLIFETNVLINSSNDVALESTFSGKGSLRLLSLGDGTWKEISRTLL